MCTVTVIPLEAHEGDAGYRLVTSRDESVRRPAAEPPVRRDLDGLAACWPVDPPSRGSWVGVAEHGMTLALLNLNAVTPPALPEPDALVSRGTIIPAVLHSADPSGAIDALAELDLARYAPFRLLAVGAGEMRIASWDRDALTSRQMALAPSCFVSSGLGDHLVEPRLALFAQWLSEGPLTPARQDAFHAHQWPLRPDISVRMRRADARTRSVTTVAVRIADDGPRVTMAHTDDQGVAEVALDRAGALSRVGG
jgi:hypothetical protein